MPISKYTGLLIVCGFALSACNLPEPKPREDSEGSTFAISSFEGKAGSVEINRDAGIPTSVIYNYKACVTDLKQKKPMIGNHFLLTELNKEISTDVNGCLNWSEKIEFNFLAHSKYLKYDRTLQAFGTHKGQRRISFAIDPWSHGEKQPRDAVDLSKMSLPTQWLIEDGDAVRLALRGETVDQKNEVQRSLWLDTGRILAQEDRLTERGFEITYEVHVTPQISLTKLNGEKMFYELTEGQFQARLQLIHTVLQGGKVMRTILDEKQFESVRVINKDLSLKARMNFKAPLWGHIYVGVQLTPVKALYGLQPFEGLFYLGDYKSTKNSGWLKLSSAARDHVDFRVEKFLKGEYEVDEKKEVPISQAPPGITLERGAKEDFGGRSRVFVPELKFQALKLVSENGHRRTLRYKVEACMRNPIDMDNIRGLDFTITKFRKSDQEAAIKVNDLTSQMDGCITWPEEITFDSYGCHEYIKGFVLIENKDLGMQQKINYFIHPWGSAPQIGQDEQKVRDFIGQECTQAKDIQKPRFIFIHNFEMALQDISNRLDQNLNLNVHRISKINIDATIINQSDLIKGKAGREDFRPGYYLVKIAIGGNSAYSKEPRYITSARKVVYARGERLALDGVDLNFKNPLDIGNRNSIYLQVLPVDKEKILRQSRPDGQIEFVPKGDQSWSSIVDKSVPLTPLVYEGKVLLLGTDRSTSTIQDTHNDLIDGLLESQDPKYLESVKNLSLERLSFLERLITEGEKKAAQNEQGLSSQATLQNYAREIDAEFYSLDTNDAALLRLQKILNLDLKKARGSYKGLNFVPRSIEESLTDSAPLSTDAIRALLMNPGLNLEATQRLCLYWMGKFLIPIERPGSIQRLKSACLGLSEKTFKDFFVKEKVYQVNEFNDSQYLMGDNEKVNAALSFSLGRSHSESRAQTNTANINAGISFKFLEFFSIGGGGQMQMSATSQDGESSGNSVAISRGTDLDVQRGQVKLNFTDYQVCHRIRINPNLFKKNTSSWSFLDFSFNLYSELNPKISHEDILSSLNKGLLICERPKQLLPISKIETFYIIQQRAENKEYLDAGDARNRWLYLALRGSSDYARFDYLLKKGLVFPATAQFEGMDAQQIREQLLNNFNFRPSQPRIYIDHGEKN